MKKYLFLCEKLIKGKSHMGILNGWLFSTNFYDTYLVKTNFGKDMSMSLERLSGFTQDNPEKITIEANRLKLGDLEYYIDEEIPYKVISYMWARILILHNCKKDLNEILFNEYFTKKNIYHYNRFPKNTHIKTDCVLMANKEETEFYFHTIK